MIAHSVFLLNKFLLIKKARKVTKPNIPPSIVTSPRPKSTSATCLSIPLYHYLYHSLPSLATACFFGFYRTLSNVQLMNLFLRRRPPPARTARRSWPTRVQ